MSLASSAASLRAITYRITTTPTKQLPQIAPQIAASLWSCKDVLSASQETTKVTSDATSVVNRFKTSLSTLLQDRTIEGRWAAVVLVKAAVESGGVEVLSKSAAWVRNLLAILKKPDPPATHNLAIITLTRVFMLTWDYSNLVREITTPTLPTFISSCLSNVENQKCSASELQTVLEAFMVLVPRHPTIFRANETQIRTLVIKILSKTSSTDSTRHYTKDQESAARHLLVLLHHCAPKQGDSEKWLELLESTVSAAHATCDQIFRSVLENSNPSSNRQLGLSDSNVAGGELEFEGEDAIGLGHWKGIFAGGERVIILLDIIKSHFEVPTANAVSLRVGLVFDLLSRVFTLIAQRISGDAKFNEQITKEEREAMFNVLPNIQVASLELLSAMLDRCGHFGTSTAQGFMELVVNSFSVKIVNDTVRRETYQALEKLLNVVGPTSIKEEVSALSTIMNACCEDLLPAIQNSKGPALEKMNGVASKHHPPNGDLAVQHTKTHPTHPTARENVEAAAASLLPVFLTTISPANISRKLRVQIERTAILTRHKDALVACVLNPAKKNARTGPQTSLLPLLARAFPDSPEIETLLRPRIPPVMAHNRNTTEVTDIEEDDDDEEEQNMSDERDVSAGDIDGGDPMTDVVSAVRQDQNAAVADESADDLYSASPRREEVEPNGTAPTDIPTLKGEKPEQPSFKRTASKLAGEEVSNKRQRAEPIAESLLPEAAGTLPGADPDTLQSSVPTTVQLDPHAANSNAAERMATLPEPSTANVAAQKSALDAGSDDSDFEMPPLTMESDTDPEDEEEEDAEAEE